MANQAAAALGASIMKSGSSGEIAAGVAKKKKKITAAINGAAQRRIARRENGMAAK